MARLVLMLAIGIALGIGLLVFLVVLVLSEFELVQPAAVVGGVVAGIGLLIVTAFGIGEPATPDDGSSSAHSHLWPETYWQRDSP